MSDMHIRDRIRELRRVRGADLVPNPGNWRTHPRQQREALKAALAEIGYADALLVRETADGRLMLIDGHLRAETTPNELVPVLVLDVTEEEGDKLLATIDPLASMAGADAGRLNELLDHIHTSQPALQKLLAGVVQRSSHQEAESFTHDLPQQFHILVICDDEQQQTELLERFSSEGLSCRAFVA